MDSSNVEEVVDEQRDDDCNMNEVVHTSTDNDEVTLLRNALHSLTQLQKLSIESKENGVSEERDLAEDKGIDWLGLIDCCAFNTAIN